MFEIHWTIVFAAFVLDFIVGDPLWLPHPIVAMGRAISFLEPVFRKIIQRSMISGLFFSVFLIGATWAIALFVVQAARMIDPILSNMVQVILLFYCFSTRSLERAAMAVFDALNAGNLPDARKKLGWIVGRETKTLDQEAVTRATVETVAENFVDGFLSPLFFALIGGVPMALAYKMVNTLDSMVGYKNDRYRYFGRASARIDDLANFIPARISVLIVFLATALISAKRAVSALVTGYKDGRRHKSPNAGFPEAAFAGALQVKLGGPNIYHGKEVQKPYIGRDFQSRPVPGLIQRACDIMMAGALISILISFFILFCFQHILYKIL